MLVIVEYTRLIIQVPCNESSVLWVTAPSLQVKVETKPYKKPASSRFCLLPTSNAFFFGLFFDPEDWDGYVPPKRQMAFMRLISVTSQQTELNSRVGELEALAVTSNRSTLRRIFAASYVPPKRRFLQEPQGVFLVTALKTSHFSRFFMSNLTLLFSARYLSSGQFQKFCRIFLYACQIATIHVTPLYPLITSFNIGMVIL
jgi:hypothetical protein